MFCMPRMEEKRDRKKDVTAEVSTVVKEYFWDVRKKFKSLFALAATQLSF